MTESPMLTRSAQHTLRHTEPNQIRLALLNTLKEATGSALGFCYETLSQPGSHSYSLYNVLYTGDSPYGPLCKTLEGTPIMTITNASFSNLLAHLTATNTFEIQGLETIPGDLKVLWQQGEVHSSMGMNACTETDHLGWIGVFRSTDQPKFTAEELAEMQRYVPLCRHHMEAAFYLQQASRSSDQFVFVTNAEGEVIRRPERPEAQAWLETQRHAAQIAEGVRDTLAQGEDMRTQSIGLTQVRFMPLLESERRCVAVTKPLSSAPSTLFKLSKKQQRIAGLATDGQTSAQIAEALGCAEETVKSHLKVIYQHFDVSNRVELAHVLQSAFEREG